jgi:hypothetical protein
MALLHHEFNHVFSGMRLDAPIESQECCLVADLRGCLAWGPDAIPDLAPALLTGLPDLTTGRPDVLYLLCALSSPAHVLHMCGDLAARRYSCCFPAEVCSSYPHDFVRDLDWDVAQHTFQWALFSGPPCMRVCCASEQFYLFSVGIRVI